MLSYLRPQYLEYLFRLVIYFLLSIASIVLFGNQSLSEPYKESMVRAAREIDTASLKRLANRQKIVKRRTQGAKFELEKLEKRDPNDRISRALLNRILALYAKQDEQISQQIKRIEETLRRPLI